MANPTGKGGFGERPQDINREGLNRRSRETWQATLKRITDMTREEAIAYVGARTKIGKFLKELPPKLPIKDGLAFISIIAYGRDPNPRMLTAIMDREEGRPHQSLALTDPKGETLKVIIEYADSQTTTPPPTPGAAEDKE